MASGVGRPPQSTACRTCTVGRIRCDFVKPICTPCRQSGRACTGAGRALVFKTANVIATAATRRQAVSTQAALTATTAATAPSAVAATPAITQSWSAASLSASAEQERHIGFFWNAYLPGGEPFPDQACQYTTCGWTRIAQDLSRGAGPSGSSNTTGVVRLAIAANSLCMLGSQHSEPQMVKDGQQVYGQALLQMRSALQQYTYTEDRKIELIIASRLLTMFTLLFGADRADLTGGKPTTTAQGQAWVGLNSGEMALILSSRPEAYQTGAAHQIFVDTRLHLFLPYLISKSRTTLSRPGWMTAPWAVVPKTPLDRLVDLVAQIPPLVEDLTRINVGTLPEAAKLAARLALRPQYAAFVAAMEHWFNDVVPGLGIDELLAGKKKKYKTTTVSPPSSLALALGLAKAHTLVLFWATCLLFRPGLLQVLSEDNIPVQFANVRAIRYNMLQTMSLAFFFGPQASWFSINIALFPLRIVIGSIDDEFPLSPAEAELMAGISNQCKGRGVSSFLDSMGQYLLESD